MTPSTSLGDLGADELDFVELVMELEEHFDIAIPDEEHIKQWPKKMVPAGAFTNIEDVVDRTVSQSMWTDELVLEMKVTDKGDGVAAFVEPGMRAFTISTRSVSGNSANMLQPGKYVDVLLTLRSGVAGDRGGETSTLLQYIEILAVDQDLDARDGFGTRGRRKGSVTLHVTPDQCNRLNHAQSVGTLTLALRSSRDEIEAFTPIRGNDLIGPGVESGTESNPSQLRPRRKMLTRDLLWRSLRSSDW